MKHYTLNYPGDPPLPVVEMTRKEFLAAHPRYPVILTNLSTGESESYPMGPDEIICDFCNGDPGDTIFVYNGMKGYCKDCAKQNWFQYMTPKPE